MALPGQANVTLVIGATDKASGVLRRIGGGITGFAKIASAAVAGAAAAFVGLGAISIKSAISVQSAFTGVAKTTDGLVDQFGELTEVGAEIKQGFRDLAKEVPIAVEELLGIGELAGQLGVPREAIVDFAEVVAALGVTTNLTTEEAATDLARLANIYQISADDMAENTKAIGSVIVDLGNNFATTERDILGFGQRIAAAGSIAGITQAEVLGIGAAMASVGVEADAGGTAVQKVLIAMVKSIAEGGESLDAFARATGKTVNEFKKDFEEDAGQVFEDFVLSLGAQGDKAILTLKELGLEDQRLVRAFLSLAGAGDLITRSMDTASEAFDTNEALGKEAQLRYGTMESQLLILKNTLRDVGVTIGDALLPFLVDAVELVKPFIEEFGEKLPQFIEEDLIPAFEKIGIFFSEDLPEIAAGVGEALTPVTEGFGGLITAVLESEEEWKAAWQDIMDFAENDFAPAIQESLDNVGQALDNLTELWKENDEKTINILALGVESILATVGVLALSLSQLFLGMTQ
ncbi:MAG: phage tail tape measure protein, partial [Anaerolineales bacterium]